MTSRRRKPDEVDGKQRKPPGPLTDRQIQSLAKPEATPFKLGDTRGLFMLVKPSGGMLWRFKYRVDGKEKLLSLGSYPDVSLKDARKLREEARKLLASGVDPAEQRKVDQQPDETFELIGREWYELKRPSWAESHSRTVLARMEQHLFPHLGNRPIAQVTAQELLACLRRMEARGVGPSAHKVYSIAGQIFRFAVATGRAERDCSGDLRGALAPVEIKHLAAVTEPAQAGALLRALHAYEGSIIVRCALKLAPLVFVRPGELRKAEWSEINLDSAKWIIPPWRMKMKQPLQVPLARQAVAILRELEPVTGGGKYVFPSPRSSSRPMSDNAVLAALRRSGISKEEMTGHGFRALARTVLDEVLGVRVDLIEHQLGHAVKDPNGRAYNRTSFLPERVEMMQKWADYLDELRTGTEQTTTTGA